MESQRLDINHLYGGGSSSTSKSSKGESKSKSKRYSPKKNSFSSISHYDPKEDKDDKLTGLDKFRKANRILQSELNQVKQELELEKRRSADLERRLNLLEGN